MTATPEAQVVVVTKRVGDERGALDEVVAIQSICFSYLDEATISFPDSCVQQRNNIGGTGSVWTSIALDFAPFVGNVKGLVEFLSGCG